jgi:hypothetical protein
MSELQEDHIPNREYLQIPQIKTYDSYLQSPRIIFFSSVLLLLDMLVIENVIVLG